MYMCSHDPLESDERMQAGCGHLFCRLCIEDYLVTGGNAAPKFDEEDQEEALEEELKGKGKGKGKSKDKGKSLNCAVGSPAGSGSSPVVCPTCAKPLTLNLLPASASSSSSSSRAAPVMSYRKSKSSILNRVNLRHFESSTKAEALMQELTQMIENDLGRGVLYIINISILLFVLLIVLHFFSAYILGAKAIVFSQFVNMLDILEYRIKLGGINCSKLLVIFIYINTQKLQKNKNKNKKITC
jgi:SNF2 family DNA or RNA helicase